MLQELTDNAEKNAVPVWGDLGSMRRHKSGLERAKETAPSLSRQPARFLSCSVPKQEKPLPLSRDRDSPQSCEAEAFPSFPHLQIVMRPVFLHACGVTHFSLQSLGIHPRALPFADLQQSKAGSMEVWRPSKSTKAGLNKKRRPG